MQVLHAVRAADPRSIRPDRTEDESDQLGVRAMANHTENAPGHDPSRVVAFCRWMPGCRGGCHPRREVNHVVEKGHAAGGVRVGGVDGAADCAGKRVEASFLLGWTFSDGVDVGNNPPILSGDGELFDRIDPKDSFKWGFMVGVNASDNVEVGFQYGHQATTLEAGGTTTREIGDFSVKTYHGYFGFNFFEPEAPVRPFLLFGLGATSFGSVDYTTLERCGRHCRGGNAVFHDARRRREDVSESQFRCACRRAVDPHLHQERCGRLLVRSMVRLLRRWRRAVLESVGPECRSHSQVLAVSRSVARPSYCRDGNATEMAWRHRENKHTEAPRHREKPKKTSMPQCLGVVLSVLAARPLVSPRAAGNVRHVCDVAVGASVPGPEAGVNLSRDIGV